MMGDSGGFGFLSGIKSVGAVESFTILNTGWSFFISGDSLSL